MPDACLQHQTGDTTADRPGSPARKIKMKTKSLPLIIKTGPSRTKSHALANKGMKKLQKFIVMLWLRPNTESLEANAIDNRPVGPGMRCIFP
ncbi:predicted protein [Uncinocarpus reesii 1704]|uniref:Uncharacterized protein n=1 Tax=Uncinocarpus reesii (strain UAMH 1704) TaxID=336963 RepID=C4JGI7_UNCRE|nr:uncharacterized protein UREG_01178 [Uncinocarpus reesii 1704]EEP76329.1 predicted protein [Uncinocarpus reesii 1704]